MTLWTRALQARSSCKCPSCLPLRGAVVRRATTNTPRHLNFAEVVTVFYTSVLATAAVLDTSWKDVKRKELDLAITDAQAEVKTVEESQRQRLLALGIPFAPASEPCDGEHGTSLFTARVVGRQASNETAEMNPLITAPSTTFATEEMASSWRLSGLHPSTGILDHASSGILAALEKKIQADFEQSARSTREAEAPAEAEPPAIGHDFTATVDKLRFTVASEELLSAAATEEPQAAEGVVFEFPIEEAKSAVAVEEPKPTAAVEERNPATAFEEPQPAVEVIFEEFAVEEAVRFTKARIESTSRQDDPQSYTHIARAEKRRVINFLRTLDRNVDRPDGTSIMLDTQRREYKTDLAFRSAKLRQETAIAKFALSLFLFRAEQEHARLEGDQKRTNTQYLKSLRENEVELDGRLEELMATPPHQAEGFESLGYPNYLSGPHEEVDLFQVLATFEERMKRSDGLRGLARILLSNSSPPDLDVFNSLITTFCDLNLLRPAWSAIEALFNSGLRANEETVVAILAFYRKTDDFLGFLQFAEHLEGPLPLELLVVPEALRLDSMEWQAFKSGAFKASWTRRLAQAKQYHRVTHTQRSRSSCRRRQTYEALISGWLRFGCVKQAWMEYQRMRRNGYQVLSSRTQTTLRRILRKLAAHKSGPELPAMKMARDSSVAILAAWREEWSVPCEVQRGTFYDIYHKRKAGRTLAIAERNIDQRCCPLHKPRIRNSQKPVLDWHELPFVAAKFGVPWPQKADLSPSLSQVQASIESDTP